MLVYEGIIINPRIFLLFQNNIKVVSIGNNHINDFGLEGIQSTKKYLSDAGVFYFGQDKE